MEDNPVKEAVENYYLAVQNKSEQNENLFHRDAEAISMELK